MNRVRCTLLACLLALAAMPMPSARADAPKGSVLDEARELTRQGSKLFDERDYQTALQKFERAYELSKNFRLQLNIAETKVAAGDYVGAIQAADFFLDAGGEDIERASGVKKRAMKLVAVLDVKANVEGVELVVLQRVVGRTPLAKPLLINPGDLKLTAQKKGFVAQTKAVSAGRGESVSVSFELIREEVAAPQPSTFNVRTAQWVSWSVTGALTLSAVVFGVLALRASSDLSSAKSGGPTSASELDKLASRSSAFALTTDVLGGLALVGAGLSTYFTVRAHTEGKTSIGVGPAGLFVTGSFR